MSDMPLFYHVRTVAGQCPRSVLVAGDQQRSFAANRHFSPFTDDDPHRDEDISQSIYENTLPVGTNTSGFGNFTQTALFFPFFCIFRRSML